MFKIITGLKYLEKTDWGWLTAKLICGIALPASLLVWPPASVRAGTISQVVVMSLLGLMLLGGILSVTGILLRGTRTKPLIVGYAIEMGGICALLVSPLILALVYGAYSASVGGNPNSVIFCLALAAPFVGRGFDILFVHLAPKKGDEGNAHSPAKEEE